MIDQNTALVTAEELLRISSELSMQGKRCELVHGELFIMSPSGNAHGYLALELGGILRSYVTANQLGKCFGAESGFLIHRDPDTVRAPDVSFVKRERMDAIGITDKYFPEPPTLAVEVVSPNDPAREVHEKAIMWIESGCQAVWLVWPGDRTITVYRSLSDIRVLTERDVLDGGKAVPGFELRVAELFQGLS